MSRPRPGERGTRRYYLDRCGTRHQCDSTYEERRMRVLDLAGLRFARQPAAIPYLWQGRWRTYRPDLAVRDAAGRPLWIEEIKPRVRLQDAQNRAKWAAARQWCRAAGWGFKVISEAELASVTASAAV